MTTSAATQKGSLFSALHALTDEIQTEKTAAARAKQAESPTPDDPGGYQGATTHPTKNIDNRGQTASEGARSSENTSDVNADQGEPGVNKAPDAKPGQQDDVQLNIGTQQSATGEDPSTEDDYKAGKDDPGSSHPAKTDNDSLDGHKYANASVGQLKGLHDQLCNGILADLANGQGNTLTKEALAKAATASGDSSGSLQPSAAGENKPTQPKTQMAGQPPKGGEKLASDGGLSQAIEKAAAAVKSGKAAPDSPAANNADLQAGYDLAAFLGIEKQAAQQAVAECLESTIQDAQLDADLLGSFLVAYEKRANEGTSPADGEDHSGGGDDTSGASDAEGTGGETAGGNGGDSEPPAGGDAGPAGGGGGSLGDLLGGGADPGGLAGGAPGGAMGQPSEEEALMQLVAALDELGIPIEELAQAGGGGGEMGGAMGGAPAPAGPPMGGPPAGPDGGMPPMDGGAPAPPAMGEGMKLASAARAFRRSGKYRFKEAADGTPQRKLREMMKGHILELMQQ